MISKNDILKMARHVLRRDQGKSDRSLVHPDREWSFGLVASAVCFLGGSLWAADVYLSSGQIVENQDTHISDGVVLKEELIESALSHYQTLSQEYTELMAGGTFKSQTEEVSASSTKMVETEVPTEETDTESELPEETTGVSATEDEANTATATTTEEGE